MLLNGVPSHRGRADMAEEKPCVLIVEARFYEDIADELVAVMRERVRRGD